MSKSLTLARTAQSPPKPISFLLILPLLFSSAFGFLVSPVLAANFNISGSDGSAKLVNTSQQINISINPDTNLSDAIVDVEVYDFNNVKVFQKFFEHQNLIANQALNVQTNWTPSANGKYQVKVGVFNNNWSQNYYWQDNAITLDISNNQSQVISGQYNISITPSSTNPAVSSPVQLNTSVNSPTSLPDAIVDVEVYDSSGIKVFQQFFEHQNLIADKPINVQANWTPSTNGTYQVKVGIFNNNWSRNYYWKDDTLKLNVGSNYQPQTQPQPTPMLIINNENNNLGGGSYTIGSDGRIYKNGQKIALHGISWFGAEGGAHVPHGLWTRNWKDMITQIKGSGFNAVRLPYCPGTLRNVDTSTIDYGQNPDLKGLKSLDVMDKIVNELNSQQMFIQLDDHNPDCNAQSDLWYSGSYTEDQWIKDQAFLADRYKNLEYFIGLDIKNEPKGNATWGTGNPATDWNIAAQKAGKAALAANPNILIFVQGVENNPTCSDNSLGHWWGGNLEPQKCTPIDSNYIPANKLVFIPHVYGPDVFNQGYFNTSDFPSNLTAIWDKAFGYLKGQGKAVAIGEYGGKYGHGGDAKDITWQNALTNYLSSKGICDNFYWSWNPNSGDTGGILQDDWTNVWQDKINLLQKYANQCK